MPGIPPSNALEHVSFELNDAQKRAVKHTTGPMLVVAGAGTGKTRVIVERIMELIAGGTEAKSILALTFTEKAAGEMLDRIAQAQTTTALDVTIATYNGFGNDLLQQYGNEWGLGATSLLGDTGQLVFLREHLDEFALDYFSPVSRPDGQLRNLAEYVSLLKQQLVQTDDYRQYAARLPASDDAEKLEKQKHAELAHFYETYLQLCRTKQVIDYDDQLYLTIELLRARPNILRKLQERFAYILVDEFQDTNPMQSALVDLLADKHHNVMVVGDDDQSIYGWRGATLANILDFKKRYPTTQETTLIENYRSTQPILDAAYRLIQHNNPARLEIINKLDKRLHAQTAAGPQPHAMHFTSFESELTWVAEDIMQRLRGGQNPGSIAVLARRNAEGVQKIHQTLELHGVAHAVAGLSNNIYDQPAVKQLIEILKAVQDPQDSLALFHALGGPLFSIDASTLASFASTARREHTTLLETIKPSEDEAMQQAIVKLADWRQESPNLTVGELAYKIISETGWKQQLYERATHDAETFTQVQALSKYFKTLREFERVADLASVQSYIANLPALKAAGAGFEDASLDISDSLVNVLSIHRAKGLEWETVYIVDCVEGSFPMRTFGSSMTVPDALRASQTEADDHLAEERRLMYVAVTRARHDLVLTYADRRENGAPRKPSRFLAELFGDMPAQSVLSEDSQTSLELFAPHAAETAAPLPSDMQQNDRLVLSVSQIDCWLRCPQDFYYRYVLRMPEPPNPTLQYGTAIHKAIERLHRGRREGNVPSLQELQAEVMASLPQADYLTARSRARSHEQAAQSVEAIYQRFVDAPLPIAAEEPFAIELADTPLTIVGRIDAVYEQGNSVEIRDFKTGTSVTTAQNAKSRATASNQLTLYALAWRQMNDEMPALLTLDFVETGQLGSVKKQPKSLDTIAAKLQVMVQQLNDGQYPSGKSHDYCHHPL